MTRSTGTTRAPSTRSNGRPNTTSTSPAESVRSPPSSRSADPRSITTIELALDTANAAALAPVWSALLTGGPEAQGRGTIGDDVRDATGRVPILWFQETDPYPTPRQRFHIDVQVPYDVAEQRIAAAVAAGAVINDDGRAPWTTVLATPTATRPVWARFSRLSTRARQLRSSANL